jgi:hypothetical protein
LGNRWIVELVDSGCATASCGRFPDRFRTFNSDRRELHKQLVQGVVDYPSSVRRHDLLPCLFREAFRLPVEVVISNNQTPPRATALAARCIDESIFLDNLRRDPLLDLHYVFYNLHATNFTSITLHPLHDEHCNYYERYATNFTFVVFCRDSDKVLAASNTMIDTNDHGKKDGRITET